MCLQQSCKSSVNKEIKKTFALNGSPISLFCISSQYTCYAQLHCNFFMFHHLIFNYVIEEEKWLRLLPTCKYIDIHLHLFFMRTYVAFLHKFVMKPALHEFIVTTEQIRDCNIIYLLTSIIYISLLMTL